ncbi:MAG TPA: zinc ribbon domain-containing protein [Armatimonadota bacterium]|nr:zinc ribbon domain-containing protein [Armatimonadota bacterium]
MASEIYCPTCGYPNEKVRGACLICYDMVAGVAGGTACPSCGTDNPKIASFCMACQAALNEGVMPLLRPDISGLVAGAAVGGAAVVADAGDYADDLDFGVPDTGGSEMDFDMGTEASEEDEYADEFAAPPPPPDSADLDDMMDSDFAMDTTGEVVAPPAPDSSFDLASDDDVAPPPPPDSVALDLEDMEPAPADDAPAADAADDDDLGDWSLDFEE